MAWIVKTNETTKTEMTNTQSDKPSDVDAGLYTETLEYVPSEEEQREEGFDVITPSSTIELQKEEEFMAYALDRALNEELERNKRARANAIMDRRCLEFLELFNQQGPLAADAISEFIKDNGDWLKIAVLIRADYLQNLDSVVRITQDGLQALLELNKMKEIKKDS